MTKEHLDALLPPIHKLQPRLSGTDVVVAMAQALVRYRHGANVTSKNIHDAVVQVVGLLNKDVYTITLVEGLEATLELCRRYPVEG